MRDTDTRKGVFMDTAIIWISLIVGIAAVVLSLTSIWLARTSVKESQTNFERTSETLAQINERAAGTEKIVGEHFDKLMSTVLNIVNTATTGPEVRKAELEAREKEETSKFQMEIIRMMNDALQSGDPKKINTFLDMGKAISKWGKE
jgi:hypothetical protein